MPVIKLNPQHSISFSSGIGVNAIYNLLDVYTTYTNNMVLYPWLSNVHKNPFHGNGSSIGGEKYLNKNWRYFKHWIDGGSDGANPLHLDSITNPPSFLQGRWPARTYPQSVLDLNGDTPLSYISNVGTGSLSDPTPSSFDKSTIYQYTIGAGTGSLNQTFTTTNLDVENPAPSGGPNNFPSYGHEQRYKPSSKFMSFAGNWLNSKMFFWQANIPGSDRVFINSNLDLESPLPSGGPNNFPSYGHEQTYLPTNKFLNTDAGSKLKGELTDAYNAFISASLLQVQSPTPGLTPTTPGNRVDWGSSFAKTSLDLENTLPLGGPINIQYTTKIGREVKVFTTTQPFTPKNSYQDNLRDPLFLLRASDQFK